MSQSKSTPIATEVPGWCENHGRCKAHYHVIVAETPVQAEDDAHHQVCRTCLHVLGSQHTPVWVEAEQREWVRYSTPDKSRWPVLPRPSSPREDGEGGRRRLFILKGYDDLAMALKAIGWKVHAREEK